MSSSVKSVVLNTCFLTALLVSFEDKYWWCRYTVCNSAFQGRVLALCWTFLLNWCFRASSLSAVLNVCRCHCAVAVRLQCLLSSVLITWFMMAASVTQMITVRSASTSSVFYSVLLPVRTYRSPCVLCYLAVVKIKIFHRFLGNVNSRSRSLYAIARPSVVCCLSVTLVRPTQAVKIFGNISTAFGTLTILWHPRKISRRFSQGNPSAGGVKHKRGSQI